MKRAYVPDVLDILNNDPYFDSAMFDADVYGDVKTYGGNVSDDDYLDDMSYVSPFFAEGRSPLDVELF